MKLCILSWNVRGANDKDKRKVIKAFLKSNKVDLVCLQETKIHKMTRGVVRSLGPSIFSKWGNLNSEGVLGGIVVFWDNKVLQLQDLEVGKFYVSCLFRNMEDNIAWCFTGVYGPTRTQDREDFWVELGAIRGLWGGSWCVAGDFNAIRFLEECSKGGSLNSAMRRFSEVLEDLELRDLPLQGGIFTWSGGRNNQIKSRLDRFLISEEWEVLFSGSVQSLLPRPTLDHHPILLDGGGMRRGPTPFRLKNMWLKEEGFLSILQDWWVGWSFQGSVSFILMEKLKALKPVLKFWNCEIFGNVV